ncbi:MAG: HAD family hydrolase [Thermodesulfobacteriota bacterium]|nr:HAD family hydrolase [Thermodesulfobacteriota bacterium]
MGDIAAFFDMDKTIIWETTGLSSARFARKQGLVSFTHLFKTAFKMILYRLTLLDIESWYEKSIRSMTGLATEDMERFSNQWFEAMVKKTMYKEAVALIHDHMDKNHRVVIVSNAISFIVHPLADTLGVSDVICTRLKTRDGILTGEIIKPLCYGKGKRNYAIKWAKDNNIDLSRSYFYTDSHFDMELMRVVGYPVAVNPDVRLTFSARRCDWPILRFKRVPAF